MKTSHGRKGPPGDPKPNHDSPSSTLSLPALSGSPPHTRFPTNMTRMTLRFHKGQKKICSQRPRLLRMGAPWLPPPTAVLKARPRPFNPWLACSFTGPSASPLPCQLVSPVRSEMLRRQEERIQEERIQEERTTRRN